MSFGRPSARLALLFAPALLIVTLLVSLPALAQDAVLEFVGQLQAQTATTITVNGVTIDITSAEIDGPLTVGALVKVEAALINNQYVAREVDASGDDDLQPNEIELIGFVEAIDGTTLLVGGQLIDLTGAEVDAGIDAGSIVKVHVTTSETGNWVARQVALFDPTSGDNLDNNDDLGNDDLGNDDLGNDDDLDNNDDFGNDDEDFELVGTLDSVGDGFIIIAGQQFDISQAEVNGLLAVGARVRVEYQLVNGQWVIAEVRGTASGGSNDDDGNDDNGIIGNNDDRGDDDGNDDNGIIGNNDDDDDDDDNFVCGQVPNGWTTYSIQQGDTLSGLAARSGTSLSAIVGVNCVANPNSVPIGAILAVPRTPSDSQLFVGNDDDLFDNNDDDEDDDLFDNNDDDDEDDDLFGNNDDDDDDDDDNSGPGNNDDDDDDNSGPGNNDDDDDDDNSGSGGDNDDGGDNNDNDDDDDNSGSGDNNDDDDDDDD